MEARGGSRHVSIKLPALSFHPFITNDFRVSVGWFAAQCTVGVLALSSHPRHLAVTQQQQTHSLGSYCLIIANWHGFQCLESPWTRTIRSGQEGSPGTGMLPVTPAAPVC